MNVHERINARAGYTPLTASANRLYAKAYDAMVKALDGGGMFGFDWHTIPTGWANALRRTGSKN